MFLSLFYLLRANRLKVSLDEWLMLLEGMRKGLHGLHAGWLLHPLPCGGGDE